MSLYSLPTSPPYAELTAEVWSDPNKILQRPIKWGLSGTRRNSAANLMNAIRIRKTEILNTRLRARPKLLGIINVG